MFSSFDMFAISLFAIHVSVISGVRRLGVRADWVEWGILTLPELITSNPMTVSPVELWRLLLSIY